MVRKVEYRNPNHNNFPDDYDRAKVDKRILLRSTPLQNALHGEDVREAMYQAPEIAGVVAQEGKDAAKNAEEIAQQNKEELDAGVGALTQDSEVVIARGDNDTLGNRLKKMEENTDQIGDNTDVSSQKALRKFINSKAQEVGGLRPSYYQEKLESLENIYSDNLNIAFITDNHHQLTSYAPNSLSHYANVAALTHLAKIDAVIAGGDNINGYYGHDEKLTETKQVTSTLYNRVSKDTDVFFLLGNHDTGIGQNGHMLPSDTISEYELKDLYGANDKIFGESRNGDSLYGFQDYPDNKVRVIFLNSYDLPWTVGDDGLYQYDFLAKSAYRNSQLDWLANTALMLPDNTWQVMIFTHCPLPDTFETAVGQTTLTQYNSDVLIGILQAYQQGATYDHLDENAEFQTSIKADYSSQGKGTLIGLFSGHIHADGQLVYQGINCVETACSLCYAKDAPRRQANTYTEDCWDVFSVDTKKRTIRAARFGYGSDRTINY